VLASSGDAGTANSTKEPVSQGGTTIPFPTVQWPASDPLVTGVGGTALCTVPQPTVGQPRTVDSNDPPTVCRQAQPDQAELVWDEAPLAGTGGGFSHVFDRPSYQAALPTGSTGIGATRGVPDVGLQGDRRTGVLVYTSLPGPGSGGLRCADRPCSTGWYDFGGTSASVPQ
jgi:subtilase family serine protease